MKHVRNSLAQELYLRTGLDCTRPTVFYGAVTGNCNYKCRYCSHWRSHKDGEMGLEDWIKALTSIKEYVGRFHIEYSGGEPFLARWFPDLIEWCHQNDILWGVTTNGTAFAPKFVRRIVAAQPFNINISMDSHLADVHNYTRGVKTSHQHLIRSITALVEERAKRGLDFPIIVKPVVTRLNFRHLPEMVEWIGAFGPVVVNFQPLDHDTQETFDELWIPEEDHAELEQVVQQLLAMKRAGAPILNSELVLNAWRMHFREEPAPAEYFPCRVGLTNYFIRPTGDVEVCWFFEPIGNIRNQSAREIWESHEARLRRERTTKCEKLCLFTCLSQKTLTDKVKMGVNLLKTRARKPSGSAPYRGVIPTVGDIDPL